jgi:D-arabinose 1-dehydrogenase-like Zn-dependent alcohol dehydrogenase
LVVFPSPEEFAKSPSNKLVGRPNDPASCRSKRIQGWASGIPTDSEDTLRFAEQTGVRPMVEEFPLDRVNEAYARMVSGKAQFSVVPTM